MLSFIKISNYALIERAELEFGPGFNVVTGESGAGKSILMGAVELLLGGRVDRSVVRTGADRCEVTGCFDVPPHLVKVIAGLLMEAGIPFDPAQPELQLRRVIGASSVRNFINDTPVSARLLGSIGEQLIDLHGANEQLSLLVPARQLDMLDRYAGTDEPRALCAKLCDDLAALRAERDEFNRNLPDEAEVSRLELLLEDIDKIDPAPGEDEELSAKHKLGSNSRQVLETAGYLTNALTESENSLADQLGSVYRQLLNLSRIDEKLTEKLLLDCDTIQESINALSSDISDLASRVDLDAEALAAIENRLSDIFTLKRRYGPSLEQVLDARDEARKRLKDFTDARKHREEFDQREKELEAELKTAAETLSKLRRKAAEKFAREVHGKLGAIGFARCILAVDFSEIPPCPSGMDRIEFMFSANAGEPLKPLNKVISGGELSRFMLSIKACLKDLNGISTYVFDEIDTGISGVTAHSVARKFVDIAVNTQVIAVSHLPQICAAGDKNFLISKSERGGSTVTSVLPLDDAGKADEIVRLTGGGNTEAARKHAAELIAQYKR